MFSHKEPLITTTNLCTHLLFFMSWWISTSSNLCYRISSRVPHGYLNNISLPYMPQTIWTRQHSKTFITIYYMIMQFNSIWSKSVLVCKWLTKKLQSNTSNYNLKNNHTFIRLVGNTLLTKHFVEKIISISCIS